MKDLQAIRDEIATMTPTLISYFHARAPETDYEDLVQETLLRSLEHVSIFRADSSVATWVTKIAACTLADYYRKLYRNRVFCSKLSERNKSLWEIEHIDDTVTIETILQSIPAKYATVLHEYYIEASSYSEIAEKQSVTYEAIRWLKRRAILACQKKVKRSDVL